MKKIYIYYKQLNSNESKYLCTHSCKKTTTLKEYTKELINKVNTKLKNNETICETPLALVNFGELIQTDKRKFKNSKYEFKISFQ